MRRTDPIKRPMTAGQVIALDDILQRGGKIVRHQGGYWTEPGASKTGYGRAYGFSWWLNTSTVDGLVRRGELEYTEWKDGRNGKFPTAAICRTIAVLSASEGD